MGVCACMYIPMSWTWVLFIFMWPCKGPKKKEEEEGKGRRQKKGKKEGRRRESDLKSDHLQRLTCKMSHLYYKWPGTSVRYWQ